MNLAQKVLKNTGVVFLGQVVILGLNLLVMVYLARYLGEVQFGMFSFAIVFVSYFAIIPDFGMKPIIVREISREKDKAPSVIGISIIVKFLFSIFSIFLILLVANFLGYSRDLITLIFLLSFTILITSKLQTFRVVFESVFEADLKMEFPFLFRTIDAIVLAGLTGLLIYLNRSLTEITFIYVVSAIPGFFLTAILSIKYSKPSLRINTSLAKWLILQSLPLAIYVTLTRVYMNADIFFLKMLKGDAAVGYYSAAYRLTTPLNFIPLAIIISVFPLMSKYYKDSKQKLVQSFNFGVKILVLIGLAISIPTSFLYEKIIKFLYTEIYLTSALPLMILMWAEFFIFLILFLVDFNTSVNKQNQNTYAAIIMFLLNVGLNLLFIPKWDVVGASLAKLITVITGFGILYYYANQNIDFSGSRIVIKIVPISLCFSFLLYLIREWNFILVFIVSPIILFIFVFSFRFFTESESRALKDLIIKIKF